MTHYTEILRHCLYKALLFLCEISCLPCTVRIDAVDHTGKTDKKHHQIKNRKNRDHIPLLRIILPDLLKILQKAYRRNIIKYTDQHIKSIQKKC